LLFTRFFVPLRAETTDFIIMQQTKRLTLLGLVVTVPFYTRLRESGYNETYMRMYDHVKPFVKLQLKYSLRNILSRE